MDSENALAWLRDFQSGAPMRSGRVEHDLLFLVSSGASLGICLSTRSGVDWVSNWLQQSLSQTFILWRIRKRNHKPYLFFLNIHNLHTVKQTEANSELYDGFLDYWRALQDGDIWETDHLNSGPAPQDGDIWETDHLNSGLAPQEEGYLRNRSP